MASGHLNAGAALALVPLAAAASTGECISDQGLLVSARETEMCSHCHSMG